MGAVLLIKQMLESRALGIIALFYLASWPSELLADGQADLRLALKQLQSTAPIAVQAQFKLFGRSGDHDGLIEREGLINMTLLDDAKGLHAIYSPELIAQLHAEELAKIADENVKNSALNAVGQFEYWEWRELLYPAAQLELVLERYRFIEEKTAVVNGLPARQLTFKMAREKVDKSYRKYIKKYHNQLTLWIDEKGVPIASQLTEKGSGRIFLVIGFEFKTEIHSEYRQQAERLLAVKREVKEESSGATMQSQRHFISTLDVVSLPIVGTSTK